MRQLTGLILLMLGLAGCQQAYFATMEKFGVEKREILVDRVKDARDAQVEGQQQFKDALDELSQLLKFHGGDLQQKYEALDAEYQQSVKAAELVSSRINKVESVADALFNEWRDELDQYQNASLKSQSKQKLVSTEKQFSQLLKKMRSAEKKMQPVLKIMHDNVLFLKHNLNAKAIGSIQTDFAGLQQDVSSLISEMNKAIADSNAFIAQMQSDA
ncbi:MAG: DNA repair protein [Chromatiales bacterium RIFOXYA1_FULL_46_5]|nr:MAG: DNA repair protein [Chromatiales bacterium RIFOXYA1_FULL_46_5]